MNLARTAAALAVMSAAASSALSVDPDQRYIDVEALHVVCADAALKAMDVPRLARCALLAQRRYAELARLGVFPSLRHRREIRRWCDENGANVDLGDAANREIARRFVAACDEFFDRLPKERWAGRNRFAHDVRMVSGSLH